MEYTFFSPKLYLQGIKKIRAAGIAAAICIGILNSILPIIGIIEKNFYFPGMAERKIEEVTYGEFAPFSYLFVFFAPLMVYMMFSFLNERSKSDFYHSLPQTRSCVFISFTAAILTWVAAILAGSYIINSILWGIAPYYHLSFSTVIVSFINFFILSVFMAGFMSLAMTLTGTTVSNVLIFILATLFTRTVGTFFIYSVGEITPVWLLSESWLQVLSFEYFLPFNILMDMFDNQSSLASPWLLVYSLLIGTALLAISCLLYKNRRSEIAGQSAPNKTLQTVYRSAVTLPFLLIMVYAFFMAREVESYQVILLAVALLVYMLYELMTTKKVKNMFKSLTKFYIPVLAALLFLGSVYVTSNTINSIKPDADDISGVCIISRTIYSGSRYEDMVTQDIFVESEEVNETISETLSQYINAGTTTWGGTNVSHGSIKVLIKLNSGITLARRIYMPEEILNRLKIAFADSEEYKEKLITLPEDDMIVNIELESYYVESNGTMFMDIWKSFKEEFNALSDEQKIEYKVMVGNSSYYDTFSIRVNGYYTNGTYFYSTYPLLAEYTPKTTALAANKLNTIMIGYDSKNKFADYHDQVSKILENKISDYSFEMYLESINRKDLYSSLRVAETTEKHLIYRYQKITEFLATSDSIFDFTDPERSIYRIELFSQTGPDSNYYDRQLVAYISLSDEEVQKIIDYT